MNNIKVRTKLFETNMPRWKCAELLGVSEMTLYRMLRNELPEDEQDRICRLIDEYAAERMNADG